MIEKVIRALEEEYKIAQKRMNDRYNEFEGFYTYYPDGPIGDPESLQNETACNCWANAIRIARGANDL